MQNKDDQSYYDLNRFITFLNRLITLLISLRTRNTENERNEFLQGVLLITFRIVFHSFSNRKSILRPIILNSV